MDAAIIDRDTAQDQDSTGYKSRPGESGSTSTSRDQGAGPGTLAPGRESRGFVASKLGGD
jgi:hypothetical protein